jgi:hypothetical protein
MIHGIGVPIQDSDPEKWVVDHPDIPYLTWNSSYGHRPYHWPMIWKKEQLQSQYPDGTPILLINEPEYKGQANLEYNEAAEVVRRFRDWPGMVYGCGTAWYSDGYKWLTGFIEYLGDDISIITGMHLHCYAAAGQIDLHDDYAVRFAEIAMKHNWPVVISEYGIVGADDEERNRFLNLITSIFSPTHMFLFSWKYHLIPDLDMVNSDGSLTDIGKWWYRIPRPTVWLPLVSRA